jgi:hypothetical protein
MKRNRGTSIQMARAQIAYSLRGPDRQHEGIDEYLIAEGIAPPEDGRPALPFCDCCAAHRPRKARRPRRPDAGHPPHPDAVVRLIRKSGEEWIHIDGHGDAYAATEDPGYALPVCAPCYGAVGPYSAEWWSPARNAGLNARYRHATHERPERAGMRAQNWRWKFETRRHVSPREVDQPDAGPGWPGCCHRRFDPNQRVRTMRTMRTNKTLHEKQPSAARSAGPHSGGFSAATLAGSPARQARPIPYPSRAAAAASSGRSRGPTGGLRRIPIGRLPSFTRARAACSPIAQTHPEESLKRIAGNGRRGKP